jgi:hypothetical protein
MRTRATLILVLFLVVVGAVIGVSRFLQAQPPLPVRIAVHPLAAEWARAAAAQFNAQPPLAGGSRRIQIEIETIDDLQVWGADRMPWNSGDHPDGWIPAAAFSLTYAREQRLPLSQEHASLAVTPLVWGGFADAISRVTNAAAQPLDWQAVQSYASAQRLVLAYSHPGRTIAGLAVALSGAGAFHNSAALTSAQLSDAGYRAWFVPVLQSVPNFNTLGASPAQTIAARGPSVGEIGLLPESDWLNNRRGQLVTPTNPLQLAYPAYSVTFEFPLALWDDPASTDPEAPARTQGAAAFGDLLLSAEWQRRAADYGLRPAGGVADLAAGRFAEGAGAPDELPPTAFVQPPSRTDVLALIGVINQTVR